MTTPYICVEDLNTRKFEWFDLECLDMSDIFEHFEDEDEEGEYQIVDSEGEFCALINEHCLHPSSAIKLYELLDGLYDDNEVTEAYIMEVLGSHYLFGNGIPDYLDVNLEHKYYGHYESEKDYAEQYVEESVCDIPEWVSYHIDYDSVATELFNGDMVSADAPDGGIFVFLC